MIVSRQEIEIALIASPKVKSRSQQMLTFYPNCMKISSAEYFWPNATPSLLKLSAAHRSAVRDMKALSLEGEDGHCLSNRLATSALPAFHPAVSPALVPNH